MRYRVLIEQDEDGMFAVECPSLPACIVSPASLILSSPFSRHSPNGAVYVFY